MLIQDVVKLSPMDRLVYWIKERHQIYLKKRAGLKRPWTDDTILQSFYFCCPYRENDKTTVWLRDNIREPMRDDPGVVFAVIAFRWFNLPSTGHVLLGDSPEEPGYDLLKNWDTEGAVCRLNETNGKVFTGAFNISNSGSTKPKINRVCEDYIQPVWEQRFKLYELLKPASMKPNLESAHGHLMKMPGLGGSGFMAAQVIADLKYTHVLENAEDWWTWCSPGPGSRRGLNRVLGLPIDSPVPKDWLSQINRIREEVNRRLPKMSSFHAQDIQNCLCEYSKYCVALEGDGHMKRKYAGK